MTVTRRITSAEGKEAEIFPRARINLEKASPTQPSGRKILSKPRGSRPGIGQHWPYFREYSPRILMVRGPEDIRTRV